MAFNVFDRVRETFTTTGTGDLTLNGTLQGFRTFGSVLASGDTTWYVEAFGGEWEVGVGTFTGPATLSRTTVLSSSNGGSLVNFSAGSKHVFISPPASLLKKLADLATLGPAASRDVGTAAGNVPALDAAGKLLASILPAIAITDTFVVASQAAMLALTAQRGDIAVRTDLSKSFVLSTDSPSTLADWIELRTPLDAVQSVAGLTGTITAADLKTALAIAIADVSGLQAALNGKAAASYAVASDVRAGSDTGKIITSKPLNDATVPVQVAYSATVTLDLTSGFDFEIDPLTGYLTLANPATLVPGKTGTILLTQDATGGRTVSYGSAWKFAGGTPTASTAANAVDMIAFKVNRAGTAIRATFLKGFA